MPSSPLPATPASSVGQFSPPTHATFRATTRRRVIRGIALGVTLAVTAVTVEGVMAPPAWARPTPSGSHTIDVALIAATYVDQAVPDLSMSSSNELWVGRDGAGETQTLLRFGLGVIPSGSIIVDATLNLVANRRSGYGTNGVVVSMSSTSWDTTATWNTRPVVGPEDAPMTFDTTDAAPLARMVDQWVNDGAPNRGLIVRPTPSVGDLDNIYGDETSSAPTARPSLRVTIAAVDPSAASLGNTLVPGPLDGSCGDGEIDLHRFFPSRPALGSWSPVGGQLQVSHNTTTLNACVSGIGGTNSTLDTIVFGVSTGEAHPVPDGRDVRFSAAGGRTPVVERGNGSGGWAGFSLPGWSAARVVGSSSAAEFRIPLGSLGWSCGPLTLHVMASHRDVDATGDHRAFPSTAAMNRPSDWVSIMLVGLPACPTPSAPTPPAAGRRATGSGSEAEPAQVWTSDQIAAFVAFVNAIQRAEATDLAARSAASRCRSVRRHGRIVRSCSGRAPRVRHHRRR